MDRSVKIFRQLEGVFKPNRMMFMELKGGGGIIPHHNVSSKKLNTLRKNFFFRVVGQFFVDVRFWWAFLDPNPGKSYWRL
jgi:hypothetical protein